MFTTTLTHSPISFFKVIFCYTFPSLRAHQPPILPQVHHHQQKKKPAMQAMLQAIISQHKTLPCQLPFTQARQARPSSIPRVEAFRGKVSVVVVTLFRGLRFKPLTLVLSECYFLGKRKNEHCMCYSTQSSRGMSTE